VGFTYQPNDSIQKDSVIMQGVEVGTPLKDDTILVFSLSAGITECPYPYSQKLLLTATGGSSHATMQLQNWEDGDWKTVYTCKATIGKNGAGPNYGEGKGITPTGVFKLGVILCQTPPANNWPYRTVTTKTCIVDDTASPLYNTIQNTDAIPAGTHVDTIGDTILNGNTHQCIYIQHNGDGLSNSGVVAGKGSAITVCGKTSSLYPTNGCVDVAAADLSALLAKMDYQDNPHIEIVVA
jgi:L,D-peptidoglycan transpeptidase YkuD (ErfK/YbiS/YcfS/YnhG family)